MKKLMALLALIFILTAQTNPNRTIVVTLVDDFNQPVVGQPLQLEILVPVSRQSCQTDDFGSCTFFFNSERELVQGVLMIPGRGNRSLTFKGERLELALQFTPEGFLSIPTDYLPTSTQEVQPTFTPEVQPSVTPEPSPTPSRPELVEGQTTTTPAVVPPLETTATLESTTIPEILTTIELIPPASPLSSPTPLTGSGQATSLEQVTQHPFDKLSASSAPSTQNFLELWPLFLVALVLLTLTTAGFLTYITWSN
jgi:hypothetical protein